MVMMMKTMNLMMMIMMMMMMTRMVMMLMIGNNRSIISPLPYLSFIHQLSSLFHSNEIYVENYKTAKSNEEVPKMPDGLNADPS